MGPPVNVFKKYAWVGKFGDVGTWCAALDQARK